MPNASKRTKRKARVVEQRGSTDLAVRAVVARHLQLPPDDLSGELDLTVDLGIAADERPVLLSAMGEALDARFPDDFLDGVSTYADLTRAVRVSLSPQ